MALNANAMWSFVLRCSEDDQKVKLKFGSRFSLIWFLISTFNYFPGGELFWFDNVMVMSVTFHSFEYEVYEGESIKICEL